ncbi:hypothetical protein LCGC14_2279770, partial [marine sediment metagenome]
FWKIFILNIKELSDLIILQYLVAKLIFSITLLLCFEIRKFD